VHRSAADIASRRIGTLAIIARTLDDNDLLVQAAMAGHRLCPEHFAKPFLESGELVTVLDDWCPPTPGVALYCPRSRHLPSPLRPFIDVSK